MQYYQKTELSRTMQIDNNYDESEFRVEIDIVLNNFPCQILSLC